MLRQKFCQRSEKARLWRDPDGRENDGMGRDSGRNLYQRKWNSVRSGRLSLDDDLARLRFRFRISGGHLTIENQANQTFAAKTEVEVKTWPQVSRISRLRAFVAFSRAGEPLLERYANAELQLPGRAIGVDAGAGQNAIKTRGAEGRAVAADTRRGRVVERSAGCAVEDTA